ncbi:MAG: TlpA disulfide reductase family protein [Ilumatobacteraceae bacterium]
MSVTRRQVVPAAVAGIVVAVISVVVGIWVATVIDDSPPIDGEVVLDEPGIYDQPVDELNASVVGVAVPSTALVDAAGAEVDLGTHRGGPMVINLWFSRCAPCQRELKDFAEVHAEVGDRVRFVGVDPFDTVEAMEQFAAARGVTYELLRDPERAFTNEIGVVAFPVTLFVDGAGRIVRQTGAIDADELRSIIADTF